MKGYWLILGTEITDQVAQDEYNRLWAPIAAKYKARLKSAQQSNSTVQSGPSAADLIRDHAQAVFEMAAAMPKI
jgi:hypothetical protein